MHRRISAALLLSSIGSVGPALADAVTYKGTLGKAPIILEMVAPPKSGGQVFARFAYMSGGTDIPLSGIVGKAGSLRFEEEARCTETTCIANENGELTAVPFRADWRMTEDGTSLTGTRTDRATGQTVSIKLKRRGARLLDLSSQMPLQALMSDNSSGERGQPRLLDRKAMPYDFLKMDWPRVAGPETRLGDVVLRMETDKRTGIEFPTVITLGGPDTAPINAYLLQQRLQAELTAFSCRSQAYASFSWDSAPQRLETDEAYPEDGTETAADGPDQPTVSINHVSQRLIGLSQSNSFYCGGAHPNNYTVHYLADAKTGVAITPETLLAGWEAVGRDNKIVDPAIYDDSDRSLSFGPSAELVDYVRANRVRFDAETEAACSYDELIGNTYYFGVYLTQDDLVFTLRDLPHAIFACTEDLLTVPLAEARPFLTRNAAGTIPALDR